MHICSKHPIFMVRICVYKGIVEIHVLLTKNETKKKYWNKIFYASNVKLMRKNKTKKEEEGNSDLQEDLC